MRAETWTLRGGLPLPAGGWSSPRSPLDNRSARPDGQLPGTQGGCRSFPLPFPVMCRSRERPHGRPQPPAWQLAPRYLVYRQGSLWDHVPRDEIYGRIRALMPAHLREGWRLICADAWHRDQGALMDATADWMVLAGAVHGFRPPTTAERARNMGMGAYLHQLDLPERDLYDAQGNSFDLGLLGACVGSTLAAWLRGEDVPRHRFPAVQAVLARYQEVRTAVEAAGHAPVTAPVPPHVIAALREIDASARVDSHRAVGPLHCAAHGGRGMQ